MRRNKKCPAEYGLRRRAQRKSITININYPSADYKRENDRYFRLWLFLREKIARKADESRIPNSERIAYDQILKDMIALEADEILED